MIIIQSQHLAGVWITFQQQLYQLIETIDDRIGLSILILLKFSQTQQIRWHHKRDTAKIYITAFVIRPICITTSKSNKKFSSVFVPYLLMAKLSLVDCGVHVIVTHRPILHVNFQTRPTLCVGTPFSKSLIQLYKVTLKSYIINAGIIHSN